MENSLLAEPSIKGDGGDVTVPWLTTNPSRYGILLSCFKSTSINRLKLGTVETKSCHVCDLRDLYFMPILIIPKVSF